MSVNGVEAGAPATARMKAANFRRRLSGFGHVENHDVCSDVSRIDGDPGNLRKSFRQVFCIFMIAMEYLRRFLQRHQPRRETAPPPL